MSSGIKGLDPSVRRDVAARPTGHSVRPNEAPVIKPADPQISPSKILKDIPTPPRAPELSKPVKPVETPAMASLVPLAVNKLARASKATQESSPGLMQVLLPSIKPQSTLQPQAYAQEKPIAENVLREKLQKKSTAGFGMFWSKAPADLKWITLSLPVILCVWFFTAGRSQQRPLPGQGQTAELASVGTMQPIAAPVGVERTAEPEMKPEPTEVPVTSAESVQPPSQELKPTPVSGSNAAVAAVPVVAVPGSFNSGLERFKKNLKLRASIALEEDFHSGLSLWSGRKTWASSWGYDNTGLVRAGQLALYKPSAALSDYFYEITTSLDRRSVGWVYRATDLDNYYASRIVVVRPGLTPSIVLERYAVINGKAGKVQQIAVPAYRGDSIFTVGIQVSGNSFTTYWQGQIIDSFSDDRLTAGGVGLYAPRGEESRIFRISLTHNNDLFGRICGLLAPAESPNSGSVAR